MMKLSVDASNVVAGGGVTHLVELMRHADPPGHGFREVEIWSSEQVLDRLEERPWLLKRYHRLLEGGLADRYRWKLQVYRRLKKEADLVFVPSTGYHRGGPPVVTMCRNLLPLEWGEINRYPPGRAWLRAAILRFTHLRAYRKSAGVIYLNEYCRERVAEQAGRDTSGDAVIPHGINPVFLRERGQYEIDGPLRLLCVSSIDAYKHQWVIAEAAARLRQEHGVDLQLTLVGAAYNGFEKMLEEVILRYPVLGEIMEWEGAVPYGELPARYREADAFVYGSTCESFGMTLLEAMGSGLPVACSGSSSMGELLGEAGIYYDAESADSCMEAVMRLYKDTELRAKLGREARRKAGEYDWGRCARETFRYLQEVAER